MKKMIWALIALLPLSVLAANSKWLYGHGPSQHHQAYTDTFTAPEPDPAAEYRDPASAPGAEKDYDSKNEEADPRDEVFDRGAYISNDWENSPPSERPSDWND